MKVSNTLGDYPIITHIHSLIDIDISGISLIDENDYWPRIKKLKST